MAQRDRTDILDGWRWKNAATAVCFAAPAIFGLTACDSKSGSQVQDSTQASGVAAAANEPTLHPKPVWIYAESQDPISKVVIATATAKLSDNALPDTESDVTWSCPDRTTDSTQIMISTYRDQRSHGGALEPLDQNPRGAVQYRFDGVALSQPPLLIKRELSNSMTFGVAGITRMPTYADKGLVTLKKARRYEIPDIKDFYIVDPDFVVRFSTELGDETLEFSLEEPSIKKLLSECGFTYGTPPKRNVSATDPTN